MDVTMPQLGEAVDDGTITAWLKKVGESVEAEEPLFEVSTDKVDTEVPAPASGVLQQILVDAGERADVGARLAVLLVEGEDGSGPEDETKPIPDNTDAAGASSTTSIEARPTEAAGPDSTATMSAGNDRSGSVLSPLVRKLLRQHDVEPGDVQGTGHAGRITRDDVLRAVDARAAMPIPRAPEERKSLPAKAIDDGFVPFSRIRKSTADHMARSKSTSPHVYTSIEVDFQRIHQLRATYKESFQQREGAPLTYLPFICRAACDALRVWPRLNASVEDDGLRLHSDIHLAVAVDLDHDGLVAPRIRQAADKRLAALARDIAQLSQRARSKGLMPDDVIGGTFTITNMGPFGTHMTLPIINQPQVAIMATDGIKPRPVAVKTATGEYSIAVRHTGYLTIAWDHRAVDGAYAAGFLAKVKEILEGRDWAAELL